MGIRLLNTFLQKNVRSDTSKINLRELHGKRIVVDASIYMYRFAALGDLIENMYNLCSIFRYYKIHALFVFDGKYRRQDKNYTIRNRQEQRRKAKNKYDVLEGKLTNTSCETKRDNLLTKMAVLRRSFVKINDRDIREVQDLLDSYGIMYRVASGEADELCAALVINKTAYACLSEDTDLFAYGCPRVLKYISLINHTAILYILDDVLDTLTMSFQNFKTLCLMSGNDYIINYDQNIFYNYKLYYNRFPHVLTNKSFLVWLFDNKYLTSDQYKKIKVESETYENNVITSLTNIGYFLIRNKNYERSKLQNILKNHGFIFPE